MSYSPFKRKQRQKNNHNEETGQENEAAYNYDQMITFVKNKIRVVRKKAIFFHESLIFFKSNIFYN